MCVVAVSTLAWWLTATMAGRDAPGPDIVDHDVVVAVDPSLRTLDLVDRLRLPPTRRTFVFELHAGLGPTVDGGTILARHTVDGMDILTVEAQEPEVVVRAHGRIGHEPRPAGATAVFADASLGSTIEPRGAYLAPGSRWLPTVVDDDGVPLLVTGRLHAKVPSHWRALSEGAFDTSSSTWTQSSPVEGLHLIAGPFTLTTRPCQGVEVSVWLRAGADGSPTPDSAAIVDRVFDTVFKAMKTDEALIGKYPHPKFAVVENFAETGYGMPSFTVLGSTVLRLPFVVDTSVPHELMHNWWGNGVFPPAGRGNWTEGLTSLLADHLRDEQQGRGSVYRRRLLQRFQDVVAVDDVRDFPLAAFTARGSPASEAVGYGKAAMVFHMLRRRLGDDAFIAGLQQLWRRQQFRRAGWDDVRDAFEATAPGAGDLDDFFEAWTTLRGAPALRLVQVSSYRGPADAGSRRRVTIVVEQTQGGPVFPLLVPFLVTTDTGRTVSSSLPLTGRRATATVEVPGDVVRVDVDPFFDVFRALHDEEMPPALSRALGAPQMLFVTPTSAPADEIAAWRAFASTVCPPTARCRVVDDVTVGTLPDDAAVWVLGSSSLLRGGAFAGARMLGARFDDHGFFPPGAWERVRAAKDRLAALRAEVIDPGRDALAVVVAHPRSPRRAMVFVSAAQPAQIAGLARKLPHDGSKGFLALRAGPNDGSVSPLLWSGVWSSSSSPLSWIAPGASAGLGVTEPPPLVRIGALPDDG